MINKICKKCGECCKCKMGPVVFPMEIKRISEFVSETYDNFLKKYCIHQYLYINSKKVEIYYLKIKENACIFLNNNLCMIYEERPYQCKNAPYNYLAKYYFWKHMPCVSESDFLGIDSLDSDKKIFRDLLYKGYQKSNCEEG